MMKPDSLIRTWLLPLFVAGGLLLFSCSEKATDSDEGFALFYPGISEICPSTNMNITPTWRGAAPANFSISGVRFGDGAIQTDCFSVDAQTGVFSIANSGQLEVGAYTIDIACESNGKRYEFPAAIEVKMMKPVPDGIVVDPPAISAVLAEILSTGADVELPTAQITTDGSNHVQIKKYLIANVYRNGTLANACKTWFKLSDGGEFSIVPDNGDFEAGVYTFDFKLTTYIVGAESQEGIFPNALSLDVTSAPTRLIYDPASARIEQGVSGQSVAPAVKGSLAGLTFAVKSVTPDNAPGITVNPNTGVLTFPETMNSTLDETYSVSLTVSNDYGSMDFEDAYAFTVITYITPISGFSYDDVEENISGVSLSNSVAAIVGDEITYSFVNLPAALSDLKIDAATGTVTSASGVELPVGEHTVTVRATNVKGSMDASFTINVVANPNYFTYVRWGNNLGLTPIEKYGNQFRIYQGTGKNSFPVLEHDIPTGRPVTYGNLLRVSDMSHGASISATTGQLDIYAKAEGLTGGNIYAHAITIDVTVGTGEAAITRRIPIFIDQCGPETSGGHTIEYTPFAFRVNPKTGGTSVAPVIANKSNGSILTGASLDFRGNARYGNLYGPAEHKGGVLKNDKTVFLKTVWDRYYAARGTTVNYTARNPMSYYDNATNGFLNATGGYIEPGTLRLIINPEKFVDDYGYADGIMMMTLYFNETGVNPHTVTSLEVNRLIIWFDPSYTE